MFRQKQLSDAEYVEQIRRRVRTHRRMWWVWLLLFFAMLYGLVRFGVLVAAITGDFPAEKGVVATGLFVGVLFGFALSLIAHRVEQYLIQWILARQEFRTEQLMLKYYDELLAKDASRHALPRKP